MGLVTAEILCTTGYEDICSKGLIRLCVPCRFLYSETSAEIMQPLDQRWTTGATCCPDILAWLDSITSDIRGPVWGCSQPAGLSRQGAPQWKGLRAVRLRELSKGYPQLAERLSLAICGTPLPITWWVSFLPAHSLRPSVSLPWVPGLNWAVWLFPGVPSFLITQEQQLHVSTSQTLSRRNKYYICMIHMYQ